MKKSLSFFLMALVMILGLVLFFDTGIIKASAATYGKLTYTVSNGKVTITDCDASVTSVTIPSKINGYPVTSIGYKAFYECKSLTSISIPDSVTSIGGSAFSNCTSLTNITIPDSVTSIGGSAFSNCTSLTSITIPEGATSIGEGAFDSCTSLTSISIPDSVTSIGDSAFRDCTSLVYNTYDNGCYIGNSSNPYLVLVKAASENITSCDINKNTRFIHSSAFEDCTSLASVSIGKGVTSIGEYAFYKCTSLTSVSIGNGVTSIGNRAFYKCTSLTSIDIPDSVTSIGNYAFYECTSLTSITIPEGVTSIGEDTFFYCTSLTSINIPDSVTSIGNHAFYGCTSLTSISIGNSVTSIGFWAFCYCTSLTSIYYNAAKVSDLDSDNCVFYNAGQSGEGINLTIGKDVENIPARLFCPTNSSSYAPKITEVVFEEGSVCKSIGNYAFSGCTSLTRVDITDVAAWCNISFSNSSSNPLRYAGNLYLNGILVTDLNIPDSVTSIGSDAFYNCTSLTSVTIPDSVTSIGYSAFYYCTKLNTVYYCGTDEEWNNISIGSNNTYLTGATRYDHTPTITAPTCTENGTKITKCDICGIESTEIIPALGHRVVVGEAVFADPITIQNDSTYPFSYADGVYSSTNKAHSTSSTFTITALYDCTVKLEYSVSSEQTYDKLIIKKNGTALYTVSGVVSWTAVDMSLKAGDKLTISYSKDVSVSKNSDTGYFKLTCDKIQISAMVDKPADECEPTCTEAVVCSYCNEVAKDALGHSHTEWEMLVEPDENGDGLKTRACTRCGDEELETVLFASGDVDGDGELTNSDITLAIRAMSGWTCDGEVMRVDTNYDGKINNRDIIALIKKLAGQE